MFTRDNIKDRVAVITGGASGLGLALARRFSTLGIPLLLASLSI